MTIHASRALLRFLVAATLAALALPAMGATATVIRLSDAVQLPPGQPATLGQVARLEGPLADRLRGLEVCRDPALLGAGTPTPPARPPGVQAVTATDQAAPAAEDRRLLRLDDVRAAVHAHLGRAAAFVELRGGNIAVSLAGTAPASPAAPSRPFLPDAGTVGQLVVERIAAAANVLDHEPISQEDLLLSFAERDREFVGTRVQGLIVDIQPLGVSANMPLSISLFRGDRLIETRSIVVGVLVRRSCPFARQRIGRGESIPAGDVVYERRAVAPDVEPATKEQLEFDVAREAIQPGELITVGRLEPPRGAVSGDTIRLDLLFDSFRLTIRSTAESAGRVGDEIRVVTPEGLKLQARLVAPGHAVHSVAKGRREGANR